MMFFKFFEFKIEIFLSIKTFNLMKIVLVDISRSTSQLEDWIIQRNSKNDLQREGNQGVLQGFHHRGNEELFVHDCPVSQ